MRPLSVCKNCGERIIQAFPDNPEIAKWLHSGKRASRINCRNNSSCRAEPLQGIFVAKREREYELL